MNSSSSRPLWLGYSRLGGRFSMKLDEMGKGIALLGHGSNDLCPLLAVACEEAGMRALVIDIGGGVSGKLSGHIAEYPAAHFVYDSLRIEENASVHAQLAASAYACTLDLSFEQEASLNALMQIIANERGVCSPISLADLIQSPDTAKARTIDKLRLRLEALRSLNMVGDVDVIKDKILRKSAVLNFKGAGSPEASETAAALFLAKLIAMLAEGSSDVPSPDVIILAEANRLFKARPVFRKSQRFLTSFVSLASPKVLASDIPYGLDEDFLDTCPTRILSSATWNETSKGLLLTPNMCMFQNHPFGYSEAFIPRSLEPKAGAQDAGASVGISDVPPAPTPAAAPPRAAMTIQPTTTIAAAPATVAVTPTNTTASGHPEPSPSEKLAMRVMEEIANYPGVTRSSLVDFLSSDYSKNDLERAFDRLQAEGFVTSTPATRSGGGRRMHTLSLTQKGRTAVQRAQ